MKQTKMASAILLASSLLVAVLGGMTVAQDQNTNQNSNSNQNVNRRSNRNRNRNMNGNMNSNVNGNMNSNMMSSGAGGTMSLSATDRKFAMMAAAGGMAEVENAQLALQKASSDSVKQYAQRMIDDHTKANADLMQIATIKGVTLPTAPDAKHTAEMQKLQALSGAAFDRAYIQRAGTKDHKEMEKLFQNEATRGTDADLKAFAARTLPIVREHLSMAEAMGGMKSNMKANTNSNMNMGGSNMNGNMNSNSNSNTSNANRP
jgi:putative membrane protein